jgi:hypothetical protein
MYWQRQRHVCRYGLDGGEAPACFVALPGVEGDTACESLDAGGRHEANTSQFSALLAKEERSETRALCLTTVSPTDQGS